VLWFLGVVFKHAPKFRRQWFGPHIIQYCLPNNIILFVTIDKFDPNPVLININKLKPYKFIEDKTLQLVLADPSNMVIDEHVQTKEPLENAKFELINNYLTHGNTIGTYVLAHYHNDVPIEFNCVQNNTFSQGPIDIYILEVHNHKSHI